MNDSNKKVFFIGGGDVLSGKQDKIFLELFRDFGSKPAKLLYLPFALFGDDKKVDTMPDYIVLLEKYLCKFSENLNFSWVSKEESLAEIVKKIRSSDIIFLSGGDTQFLIDYLNKTKLSEELFLAYEYGKTIVGSSAGALALANTGYSYFGRKLKEYHGIGLIRKFVPVVHWEVECDIKQEKDSTNRVNLEENKGCSITNDSDLKVL